MDPLGDGRGCSTDSWDWAKMAPVKSEELSKGNIFSVKKISKERENWWCLLQREATRNDRIKLAGRQPDMKL